MDNTLATRLKFFMEQQGYTSSVFADKCGIPRPTLSQLLTGRNKKVNDVLINLIHKANPELSIVWLMFGEGEMLNNLQAEDEFEINSNEDGGLFQSYPSEKNEYSIVSPLSNVNTPHIPVENQNDTLNLQIKNLREQIDNLTKNPRRVTQITIYYDDSTFETFYPSGK